MIDFGFRNGRALLMGGVADTADIGDKPDIASGASL